MLSVVLVDDEYWSLLGLEKAVCWEDYGFSVALATTDSREAAAYITGKQPDIVFTDIRMPELSGIELIRKARMEGIKTQFVIVSGYSDFEYARAGIQYGVFDYQLKPFHSQEIAEILQRLNAFFKIEMLPARPNEQDFARGDVNRNFLQLLNYVDAHYAEDLFLSELAKAYFINFTYCSELFKKVTGRNFTEYLAHRRIEKACELLRGTDETIKEIALQVGYNDYSYFTRIFKKYMAITPARYKTGGVH